MGKVMERSAPRMRTLHIATFPDELKHIILSKLEFKEKLNAGLVCKEWGNLLKTCTGAARHWDVGYSVKRTVASPDTWKKDFTPWHSSVSVARWFASHAAAIKYVHVSASFSTEDGNVLNPTLGCLEVQLPLLAGVLSRYANIMGLTFADECPFTSPLLSSPPVLALLSPLVTHLTLDKVELVSPDEFVAICQLTNLVELNIEGLDYCCVEEAGLEEMTSDISKLVNLKALTLCHNTALKGIPEAISCLQNLETLYFEFTQITKVPAGLATLANLRSLSIKWTMFAHQILQFPPCLTGLKSLSVLDLTDSSMAAVPAAFSDLSALTFLNLAENPCNGSGDYDRAGPISLPASLSTLPELVKLDLSHCFLESVPVHICGMAQLTALDISFNNLHSLPDEMSGLQNLKEVNLSWNNLPAPPVVLGRLTALTKIDMANQRWPQDQSDTFKVPSPLLPILHPGLVHLDLRQQPYDSAIRGPRLRPWDELSLSHLEQALAEVVDRRPVPTLLF